MWTVITELARSPLFWTPGLTGLLVAGAVMMKGARR